MVRRLFVCMLSFVSSLFGRDKAEEYNDDFLELIEIVYGKGFLSQGGKEAVAEIVKDVSLEGKKVLDLGSGLGAPDIYLAQHYAVDIVGVDPQRSMVTKALQAVEEAKASFKGKVTFQWMEDRLSLKQFSDGEFDLVISKESILHVPVEKKSAYFKEVVRVLKPGGQIAIMDWMHSSPSYSANTKKMMEMDGIAFCLVTPDEYQSLLEGVGFTNIHFIDTTAMHAGISQDNIDAIKGRAEQIQKRIGPATYEYCLESWGYQRDAFTSHELITGIFRAKKD